MTRDGPGLSILEFRTLGSLEIRRADGRDPGPLLTQSKRVALLVYLALAEPRGPQRRDAILPLFWPELDQHHARAALRQSVYHLRKTFGHEIVATEGDESLGLDFDRVRCDAVMFERAIVRGDFETALELYRGDLLHGFHVADAAADWEDWLQSRRQAFRAQAIEAATALSERALRSGYARRAVEWARKAVALAPDDEDAIGRLLLLMERLGDRMGAVKAYEEFAERLEREYGVEPSDKTRELAGRIRSDRSVAGDTPAPLSGLVVPTAARQATEDPVAPTTSASIALETPRSRRSRGTMAAFAGGAAAVAALVWMAWGRPWSETTSAIATSDPSAPAPFVEPVLGGLHDTRIAFVSARDGNYEIYFVNGDGTEPRRVTNHPAEDNHPTLSPDGRWILFTSKRDDGDYEIYRMRSDGSQVERLTQRPGIDYHPGFSPDGKRVVWTRYEGANADIWIMDADGSNPRAVIDDSASDELPVFSPDGRSIAFVSWRDAGGNFRNSEIYVTRTDGTGPVLRLTTGKDWDAMGDWSPDGKRIAFSSAREGLDNWEVFVMSSDGSNQTNVTRHPSNDMHPSWSPDGSRIVFLSNRDGPSELYTMSPDGSDVHRLTQFGGTIPDWGPGSRASAPCLVTNGSFEEVDERRSEPSADEFFGVPSWWPADDLDVFTGETNSPDIFVAPAEVPRNFAGHQFPAHGRNYAGFAPGGAQVGATEALAGALRAPLVPGRTYEVRASFSVWDLRAQPNQVQIILVDRTSGGILVVGEAEIVNDLLWEPFLRRVTIPAGSAARYDAIAFRSPPRSTQVAGGLYVDDVDVCPATD